MQISENTLGASKLFLSIEQKNLQVERRRRNLHVLAPEGLQPQKYVLSIRCDLCGIALCTKNGAKKAAIPLKDAPPALLPRYP